MKHQNQGAAIQGVARRFVDIHELGHGHGWQTLECRDDRYVGRVLYVFRYGHFIKDLIQIAFLRVQAEHHEEEGKGKNVLHAKII